MEKKKRKLKRSKGKSGVHNETARENPINWQLQDPYNMERLYAHTMGKPKTEKRRREMAKEGSKN